MILSAGAVATPQLLELSGIGQPELLKKHGIEVKHALPAVGENFRDHINARIIWRVKVPGRLLQHMARGLGAVTQTLKYCATGGGFLSLPSAPLLAFLKTRKELETPDVQMHIVPYSIKDPEAAQAAGLPVDDDLLLPAAPREPGLDPHPLGRSRGAAGDPLQLPDRPDRPAAMVDGFHMMRKIVDAAPLDAYRGDEFSPGTAVQDRRRDPDLDPQQLADRLSPDRHLPHGTGGPNTVVDDKLKVHGIEGLRIADASIFPTMPSGNTNAPSIMVGEKAAEILKAAA